MELNESTISTLLIVAITVGVVALVVSAIALSGQRRVRAAYRSFSMGSRDDVLTLLERHIGEVRDLRREVAHLGEYAERLRNLLRTGMSRVATVRYDAFDDMGGRMSFSTAILDEHGDGLIVTSINGRVETRTYAKTIVAGRSRHNLSQEEADAIQRAMSMSGRTGQADAQGVEGPRRLRRAAGAS